MPTMPAKKATSTHASRRLLMCFGPEDAPALMPPSHLPVEQGGRVHLQDGDHVKDDHERCEAEAERHRAVATRPLLLLGHGDEFPVGLLRHDHPSIRMAM